MYSQYKKDWCLFEPTHVYRQYIFNPEPAAIQYPSNAGHLHACQPGGQNQRCHLSYPRSAGSNHTHAGADRTNLTPAEPACWRKRSNRRSHRMDEPTAASHRPSAGRPFCTLCHRWQAVPSLRQEYLRGADGGGNSASTLVLGAEASGCISRNRARCETAACATKTCAYTEHLPTEKGAYPASYTR